MKPVGKMGSVNSPHASVIAYLTTADYHCYQCHVNVKSQLYSVSLLLCNYYFICTLLNTFKSFFSNSKSL